MKPPIEGNVFTWKDSERGDVTFAIAHDFSEVVITQKNDKITVSPSALTDLLDVMQKEQESTEDEELSLLRSFNTLGTTQSCEKYKL